MDAPLGWSPDGTKIAFLSSAGQSKVAILTLADSSIFKHSAVCPSCNGSARFRSWLPDGTKILIKCENQDGWGRICVMEPDGGNPTVLSTPDLPEAALRHSGPHIEWASWAN